jgi:hypothetical protein
MKRILSAWSLVALGAVAAVWLAATPLTAQGQASTAGGPAMSGGGSGGGSGGTATVSGGGGGTATASGGSSSGPSTSGSGGGGSTSGGYVSGVTAPRDGGAARNGATGGSGYAAPRGDSPKTPGPGGRNGRNPNGHTPVGNAVPRGSVPPSTRPGTVIIVPGSYYGGYYDPWWYGPGYIGMYSGYYDPWYGGYPSTQSSYTPYTEEGSLKLKIKPREAEVYVDGYFVGVVDDFDGIFQRLHIETGPHRVEVRAPGYETLVIEVRITADDTTTYHGELKRIP